MTPPAPAANDRGGLLLHLSGPLQSWGSNSRFSTRDTTAAPTRSGLIGLIAAAMGHHRDHPLDDLTALRFTVRIDRPGTRLRDFHTVGGGMPRRLTIATAERKRRSGDTATLVSQRHYLQDAAFTVAVTSSNPQILRDSAHALRNPQWPLFLGRRACPPSGPVLLAETEHPILPHLLRLPLARTAPHHGAAKPVPVDFTADQPLTEQLHTAAGESAAAPDIEELTQDAHDEPVSFTTLDRRYRSRTQYRITLPLPADRCAGLGRDYLTAISTYLEREALR
ncbi:type I-E CRISPR-associated protein Cas5/CasD [Streptomyces sp. NPDC051636]|uniref:type I-E CRISPR-associated protein Cas5/CasD n=1 Tax=Streptomyces sp. NPDC051636 TaxID=3365663 RepID=UPI00379D1DD2